MNASPPAGDRPGPPSGAWLGRSETFEELALCRSYEEAFAAEKADHRRELPSGVDPHDLGATGWGVIFPVDGSDDARRGLRLLLHHRKRQAKRLFRTFSCKDDDLARHFLDRHGVAPGTLDTGRMPYYLLLAGGPEEIPFEFQHHLSINHAVGRVAFDDAAGYERYAESVIAAETRGVELPPAATFFSVDDDPATQCLDEHLVRPLSERLPEHAPGWRFDVRRGQDASKAVLGELFGGVTTPGFLLVASHGQGIRPGDQERQEAFQGAPVCWGKEKKGRLFHAGELDGAARLHGLITFLAACYGAGTPLVDNFPHQNPDGSLQPRPLALRPFVARLPRELLSRGALAVVGHVDRGWTLSFRWPIQGKERAVTVLSFEDVLCRLFTGQRLGHALRPLQRRYCALSARLAEMLEAQQRGEKVDERHLAMLWTAQNDARNFAVLGDPAVYLLGQRYKPEVRDAATRSRVAEKRSPRAGTEASVTETASPKSIADTAPDVTLRVVRRKFVLGYELTDPGSGMAGEKLGSVQLLEDPRSYFTGFFESIDELSLRLDEETLTDVIDAKGVALAQALLPEKLQKRLWELKGRASTLQILSDETEIPWELLKLHRTTPDAQEEAFFLCEAFALTRWLPGVQQHRYLPLRQPAMVVTQSANLPSVGGEQDVVKSIFHELGHNVQDIPSKYGDLTREMASGAYDGWHFIGHGLVHDEDPNRWKILLDDYELTPESLHGKAAGLGRGRPLVFLNACHTARGAQSFTGVGGWAAKFIELGAGAFIGASWTSRDEAAAAFAEVFYRELLSGTTIGEAVRRARLEVRESFPGDPTWLGYAVFAHPNAMCQTLKPSQGVTLGRTLAHESRRPRPLGYKLPRRRSPGQKPFSRRLLSGTTVGFLAIFLIVAVTRLRTWIPPAAGKGPPAGEHQTEPSVEESETSHLPVEEYKATRPILPIVPGKVGIVVLDMKTRKLDFKVANAVETILAEQIPGIDPVILQADAEFAEDLLNGDLSSLPGGGRSPWGVDSYLIATSSRKVLSQRIASLEGRALSMNIGIIAASEKTTRHRSSDEHQGMGISEQQALKQAAERCLREAVNALKEGESHDNGT